MNTTNSANEQATPAAVSATQPAAHTPTPWHIGVRQIGPHVYGPKGVQVADCNLATNSEEENDANAALIVRACNAWNDVAALKSRIAELEGTSHA